MMNDSVRMLEFPQHGDERGHLVVVEGLKDIPFEIKRIFYIYGSDRDVVRGCHANRRSEFVLINVSGQSKVRVRDGFGNEAVFSINRPHTGLYLPRM
ncbi:MAG: FdtA/QdtA family cupin domain-containing protein, partial [Clostridiales bacterium]|nr:FdtA/QdtA family cupin domain-containing protein [Clostridiales bacterium]